MPPGHAKGAGGSASEEENEDANFVVDDDEGDDLVEGNMVCPSQATYARSRPTSAIMPQHAKRPGSGASDRTPSALSGVGTDDGFIQEEDGEGNGSEHALEKHVVAGRRRMADVFRPATAGPANKRPLSTIPSRRPASALDSQRPPKMRPSSAESHLSAATTQVAASRPMSASSLRPDSAFSSSPSIQKHQSDVLARQLGNALFSAGGDSECSIRPQSQGPIIRPTPAKGVGKCADAKTDKNTYLETSYPYQDNTLSARCVTMECSRHTSEGGQQRRQRPATASASTTTSVQSAADKADAVAKPTTHLPMHGLKSTTITGKGKESVLHSWPELSEMRMSAFDGDPEVRDADDRAHGAAEKFLGKVCLTPCLLSIFSFISSKSPLLRVLQF